MKVVPYAFYQHPNIEKLLVDGSSCILYKETFSVDLNNERYLSSHAITLILEGSLLIEHDIHHTTIKKNELVFLPKGMYMVTDIIPEKKPFQALVFFFDADLIDGFLKNFEQRIPDTNSSLLKIPYAVPLRLYVESLLKLYRNAENHQFTHTKLLEFLHLIAISPQGSAFLSKLQTLKQRTRIDIIRFMSDYFHKPLDIEDYAYLTGRSISTFRRDFKSKFHMPPKKWLIEKRLNMAATLLKTKNESIGTIAFAVGYESTSHFIKAFRKKFGTSPKKYLMDHRKKMEIQSF
ncbi:helix-turn-helix transcriptional regulator [Spongiimicrobium salis]|uniref:helix-turn-helix transcriptional regulator n=1 Tax=Spongiimicrobium salis TaxID=1667022 RepID=UPI00374DD92B